MTFYDQIQVFSIKINVMIRLKGTQGVTYLEFTANNTSNVIRIM